MNRACAVVIVTTVLFAPATAAAQADSSGWFASPFLGATFGGDTTTSAPVVGAAAGWIGRGRLGFEAEVADSPEFFEQSGFLTYRRVTTVMGNALFRFGSGGAHLYAAGGGGLVRLHLAEAGDLASLERDKFGFNVGGGLMAHVSDHAGVRADVRYIRTAGSSDADVNPFGLDLSKFEFWRAYAGLLLTF